MTASANILITDNLPTVRDTLKLIAIVPLRIPPIVGIHESRVLVI